MRLLHRQSKGQVLVLLALTMIMLLAVIALAIDIGRAYGVKAKLNAAVDAASYEAANSLAQGSGEEGMRARAAQVAREFFAANYRLQFMGTEPPVPTVTAERNPSTGAWNVRVAATAQMPTFFAGMLGWRTLDVTAASETVRGTIDMVLVMDTSRSMQSQMEQVKDRATDFVSKFDVLDDRIGIVTFASTAWPVVSLCGATPPDVVPNPNPNSLNCVRGFNRDTLNAAIKKLAPGGMTASQEGLKKALDQLRGLRQNQAAGHRAIVFFSDGAPNTFSGRFPLQGGGNVEGNLYSEVAEDPTLNPTVIFDPLLYPQDTVGRQYNVNGLPETDLSGTIPTESAQKNRRLTKITTAPWLKCDANAAARNMAENVALEARKEGIAVYSIGLGAEMNTSQMFDRNCSTATEVGTMVLKRVANTPDSDTYDPSQPTGIFCLATDMAGLKQCFDRVASTILRITK